MLPRVVITGMGVVSPNGIGKEDFCRAILAGRSGVKRISRPGSRRYLGATEIRPVVGGLGINILTTPKGLMSGRSARKAKLGGEILCEVW